MDKSPRITKVTTTNAKLVILSATNAETAGLKPTRPPRVVPPKKK
jgi:hypothetical protein